jgi:hypothetical protein
MLQIRNQIILSYDLFCYFFGFFFCGGLYSSETLHICIGEKSFDSALMKSGLQSACVLIGLGGAEVRAGCGLSLVPVPFSLVKYRYALGYTKSFLDNNPVPRYHYREHGFSTPLSFISIRPLNNFPRIYIYFFLSFLPVVIEKKGVFLPTLPSSPRNYFLELF